MKLIQILATVYSDLLARNMAPELNAHLNPAPALAANPPPPNAALAVNPPPSNTAVAALPENKHKTIISFTIIKLSLTPLLAPPSPPRCNLSNLPTPIPALPPQVSPGHSTPITKDIAAQVA